MHHYFLLSPLIGLGCLILSGLYSLHHQTTFYQVVCNLFYQVVLKHNIISALLVGSRTNGWSPNGNRHNNNTSPLRRLPLIALIRGHHHHPHFFIQIIVGKVNFLKLKTFQKLYVVCLSGVLGLDKVQKVTASDSTPHHAPKVGILDQN